MGRIQEHVLKDQEIFIGLEDSKKTWHLCVRCGGVVVHETSMPAKYSTLNNYFRNRFPGCKITVMYEAGFRGFNLHDKLEGDGWNCVVTPPNKVTDEKCRRNKNDRIDCRRLAKNLENNDYKSCYVPDRQLREDRQISRTYGQVQRDITRLCNRIRRSFEFHGLDDFFPSGSWGRKMYRDAKLLIKDMDISSSLCLSLNILYRELEYLWDLKKELTKELKKLSESERYKKSVQLLKSAPGVGMLTAIRLTLELGDMTRFKRKEEFANYLGLIPSEYSTGETERRGHITKQGNRLVRSWLIESSWIAIKYDPVLLNKYKSAMGFNGKYKKKAIVAVARKLAIRLRALLLSGEPYIVGLVA